jgi:hypothetical protein
VVFLHKNIRPHIITNDLKWTDLTESSQNEELLRPSPYTD